MSCELIEHMVAQLSGAKSTANIRNAIETVLSYLECYPDIPESSIRNVAVCFRDLSALEPAVVCDSLLLHLIQLPCPRPFLEIIPFVFCLAGPGIVEEVVNRLVELSQLDCQYVTPVLGALLDLPITAAQRHKVFELAVNSTSSIDESDFPLLFSLILKNCKSEDVEFIAVLRREVNNFTYFLLVHLFIHIAAILFT